MGYKKLDEIMELLTDELNGFNRSLEKLEKLTKNADHIKIRPDTSEIEHLLIEHLNSEKAKNSKLQESVLDIEKQISSARLIPKKQLWIHYSIWLVSLVIIAYLAFKASRIDKIQEKAFAEGEQNVILSLRGYFDQNPQHYESYQKWLKEKDSVPNQK
jgi:t-SNARE complex subunit (syntaxin)